MRALWLILGLVLVGIGVLGIVLPLLPTTPFMLLAAFCFARSSPRLHAWLVHHPVFGPAIANWQRHGAISRKAKIMAAGAMLAAFGLSLLAGLPGWVLAIQAVCLAGAAVFVLSRPGPPMR